MIIDDDVHGSSGTEDGENYFVSMTDMMVGVLFIFVIMLMVFAHDFRTKTDDQAKLVESSRIKEDELEKERDRASKAMEIAREVTKKLDELQTRVERESKSLDKTAETRRELLTNIKKRLEAEGLHVQIDEQNGVLRLTEDAVRFPSSGSTLNFKARTNVAKIARALAAVLPNYSACRRQSARLGFDTIKCVQTDGSTIETVFIEGHTDESGPDRSNWKLSVERAVNTYRALASDAPEVRSLLNRKNQEVFSVSGYSSTRPINPNWTAEAFAANRRIDLRFVMEIDRGQRLKQILELTGKVREQIRRLEDAVRIKP